MNEFLDGGTRSGNTPGHKIKNEIGGKGHK